MSEMTPCPFCGHPKPERRTWVMVPGVIKHRIICPECQASSTHFDTAGEAIAAWDRRTAEARIRDLEGAIGEVVPLIVAEADAGGWPPRDSDVYRILVRALNRETT